MKWYTIDKNYINYLKQYDSKVPNIDYGSKLKPFLGIIFHTNDLDYFCPVTSYKNKFETMKNTLSFHKIVNKKNQVIGALSINNIIPVSNNDRIEITMDNIDTFRDFNSLDEKERYWNLLDIEINIISSIEDILYEKAEKVYSICTKNPNHRLHALCCDFQLLESKCKEYELMKLQKNLYSNEILNESIANKVLGSSNFIRCIGDKIYILDQKNLDKSLETLQHIYGNSLRSERCFENYSQLLAQHKEQVISDYLSLQDGETFYLNADEMTYLNIDQHEKSIAPVMSDSEKELDISF